MTTDLIGAASGFEILFLASAVVGTWFSRLNLSESWKDFRALGGITNGRRAIATSNIVTETLRLSIHALYIIAALFAVTQPGRGETTAVGVLILSILVYASWALTAISLISRRTRLYLLRYGLQPRDSHGRFVKED
jgi:hypothetical protein